MKMIKIMLLLMLGSSNINAAHIGSARELAEGVAAIFLANHRDRLAAELKRLTDNSTKRISEIPGLSHQVIEAYLNVIANNESINERTRSLFLPIKMFVDSGFDIKSLNKIVEEYQAKPENRNLKNKFLFTLLRYFKYLEKEKLTLNDDTFRSFINAEKARAAKLADLERRSNVFPGTFEKLRAAIERADRAEVIRKMAAKASEARAAIARQRLDPRDRRLYDIDVFEKKIHVEPGTFEQLRNVIARADRAVPRREAVVAVSEILPGAMPASPHSIYIRGLDGLGAGENYNIGISKRTTVQDIKRFISNKKGVPYGDVNVIYAGTRVADSFKVYDTIKDAGGWYFKIQT